jgi:hypothetical protein
LAAGFSFAISSLHKKLVGVSYLRVVTQMILKPRNAEFFLQLQEVTKGLDFPSSASDNPINPFLWELETKGQLTIENLLRAETPNFDQYRSGGEIIQVANLDNYWQSLCQERENSPTVIELLKTHTSFLEAAHIRSLDDLHDSFRIVFGSTTSGEWIGISPRIPADFEEWNPRGTGSPLLPIYVPQTQITRDLLARLEPLLPDLDFDEPNFWGGYRFKGFIVRVGATRELMFSSLLDSIGFARKFPFLKFTPVVSEEDEGEDEEVLVATQALDTLLQSNLSNLHTYLFGICTCYNIYAIGQTQEGDWAGVASMAVWA